MITASAWDPGKYRTGHATVRATRENGRLVLTWIQGGHAEPTPLHIDGVMAVTAVSSASDELLFAVEEVREAFPGAHAGDLIATGKQEQRIVDHLTARGARPRRVQATEWRAALCGTRGPSDAAIAIAVCGIVHGAATAPLGKEEREHAIDAAGLAVYEIACHLKLLTPLGRIPLPPHVEGALAGRLLIDKIAHRAKREAKKLKKAGLLPAKRS